MPTFEERWHPWSLREGLVDISVLPQGHANLAIVRSLPRITDAMRLAERVTTLLAERGYRDPTAGPENWHLFVRDDLDPAWIVTPPLVQLEVGWAAQDIPMPSVPQAEDSEPAPSPPPFPSVLLGPDRRPGDLMLQEGPANYRIEYGPDGRKGTSSRTAGDTWTWGFHMEDRPFAIDFLVKPAQVPPIGVLCRGDLEAAGMDVDTLAQMICEMDPGAKVRSRVRVPVPMPGGVTACAARGLQNLREALWHGLIEAEAGWVVIDAWSGNVHATGSDLPSALAAWRERVAHTQPLPPRPSLPSDIDVPEEEPLASRDQATNTTHIFSGTVHLTGPTRPRVEWPEARPENVPVFAVPLPLAAAVPTGWEDHGFKRAVRLVGDHGDVSTAFLREESNAFTLVGEGAVDAVDPATITEALSRIEADQRAEFAEFFPRFNPSPDQPARLLFAHVWDEMGCVPKLRWGSESWGEEFNIRGFNGDHIRWQAVLGRLVKP